MRTPRRAFALLAVILAVTAIASSIAVPASAEGPPGPSESAPAAPGGATTGCAGSINPDLCKIEHVIFIVQENRSFDHYFGTYESPSGDNVAGLARMDGGKFKACIPHPRLKECQRPFETNNPVNLGGPHAHTHSVTSVAKGKMNGFIKAALESTHAGSYHCADEPKDKKCKKFNGPTHQPDLLATLDERTIPNYWHYANQGVLQDHLFGSVDSWSLPAHLFIFSAWSAECPSGPESCTSEVEIKSPGPYRWTDITYLLHEAGITWKNYVGDATVVNCPTWPCGEQENRDATPWIWNPLPNFTTVRDNDQVLRTQGVSNYYDDAAAGELPQVSWVLPSLANSEHPAHGSLMPGQNHVTRLVNAAAEGPDWESTAIFLYWDDWGGFYDHVKPIKVDQNGWGIRVPGLVISPYVLQGQVDHQTLSFDAYLKFIEDRFLSSARLNPNTMSRPDSRPTVRENVDRLGDLTASFDFTQPPRPGSDFILEPASASGLPNPRIPDEWIADDPLTVFESDAGA